MANGPEAEGTSGLEHHLGYWLRFVSNHVSHAFQVRVEARGVTVSEWVVLRQMYDDRETTPNELMQALGMTQGAISKLLKRLEAKGLLARDEVPGDRRRQRIELTDEGRGLVPELARLADENDEAFFAVLPPPQREQIMATMRELVRLHHLKQVPVD